MLLFPESGPKKNFRVNSFTKTVTLHLRSIGPNVQYHMAYFALITAGPGTQYKVASVRWGGGPDYHRAPTVIVIVTVHDTRLTIEEEEGSFIANDLDLHSPEPSASLTRASNILHF
jgi:hypothetical protein